MSRKAAATTSGTWTAEEEKKLASAVETFGAHNWGKVAANVPGRSENQCSNKWRTMSKRAAATASGAWTVEEEEKKLASAVETFGTGDTSGDEPPVKRRRFDDIT
jgi:Myb-like DNA-binding protein BAS1